MEKLRLPGMPNPFYIGLNIVDQNMLIVHSSLGSTIKSSTNHMRITRNPLVLVGDYTKNNITGISSFRFASSTSIPISDNFDETKRRLWLMFDRSYKNAANTFTAEQAANKNAVADEWANVPDFLPGKVVNINLPAISLDYNKESLEKYANAISAELKNYPQITYSWVRITGVKANIYFSNTEGSKASYPNSIVRLVVNAETLSDEGEKLELYNTYHVTTESELPPLEQVLKETKELAAILLEMKKAPVFNDVYNGPVLFEGPAAAEVVRKTMFYAQQENLYAKRERKTNPQMPDRSPNKISTELRIDTRISPESMTVKAVSGKTEYNGMKLIGAYPVDMEGTVPPEELVIVENGVLKNLLCGRTPTLKMKESNGHLRVPSVSGASVIAPGVVEVDYKNGVSKEELKKQLMERAKADGLNYAIIVREMTSNLSELRQIFKVDVNTGEETRIRSVTFNSLVLNDLRKIVGASNQKQVLNTTGGEDTNHRIDYLSGCPATFITPDAFLFKDLEISKSTKPAQNKLPVVKNPLEI
jgi:predicted Zn-dependent protease